MVKIDNAEACTCEECMRTKKALDALVDWTKKTPGMATAVAGEIRSYKAKLAAHQRKQNKEAAYQRYKESKQ